jgi:hypothetical protein
VVSSRKPLTDGLSGTVVQENTRIVPKHRVSKRRFHTDTGRTAGNEQPLNGAFLEYGIQLRSVETAVPRLVHDGVVALGFKLVDYVCIPSVPDQDATLTPIRSGYGRSDRQV